MEQHYQYVPTDSVGGQSAPEPLYYYISDGICVNVMIRYPYQKLEPSQFRLLQLCSRTMKSDLENYYHSLEQEMSEFIGEAKFRGELYGQLIDVPISGNTQYDCLSYAWGTDDSECAIRLGDHWIAIPHNLYAALAALQLKDEPRLVWVDCICINQLDNEERKSQVEMMYQIYQGAREVIVDLGNQHDGSENL